MEDKIKFKRKLGAKNQGIILSMPNELIDWLDLKPGQEITLVPDEGKHGKFIAMFTDDNSEKGELIEIDSDTQTTEGL